MSQKFKHNALFLMGMTGPVGLGLMAYFAEVPFVKDLMGLPIESLFTLVSLTGFWLLFQSNEKLANNNLKAIEKFDVIKSELMVHDKNSSQNFGTISLKLADVSENLHNLSRNIEACSIRESDASFMPACKQLRKGKST